MVPLGGGGLDAAVAALNRAGGFFRSRLAQQVALRHAPRIAFAADRSFDEAVRIGEILERPRVRRDLVSREDADDPGSEEVGSEEAGDDHGA